MNTKLKRALAGMVAMAIVGVTPLIIASPASAATLAGPATVKTAGGGADLNSGDANDSWTLRLPAGAACTSDGNNGGRAHTYMIPGTQSPAVDLAFNGTGSIVGASTGTAGSGTFKNNLYNGSTPGRNIPLNLGDAAIINIPNFTYTVWTAGQIPSGVYNIGIACIDLDEASAINNYWNQRITVTYPGGDAAGAQISWAVGEAPAAPVLTTVTPGNAQLTAAFTHTASTPASTYTATATPTADPDCSGGPATSPSQATTAAIVISSLVNDCTYDVKVTASNGVGGPVDSNVVAATPVAPPRPAVASITATAGTGSVQVSWSAPASGPAPTGYNLVVTNANSQPNGASPYNLGPAVFNQNVTGLTAGTLYTFTVTPTHASAPAALSASAQATPTSAQVLQQQLTVTRPVGALVLTQVCSANGPLPAEAAQFGFPAGLPAVPADSVGTAPFTDGWPGSVQDGSFPEYPYPVDDTTQVPNAIYPTHCGVDLGIAQFVTSGPGSGQFFRASGVLNQVSVVDTRDDDIGWTINGTMSAFTSGANSFSGSQLGWTPQATDDSDPITYSDATTYDQLALAGPGVAPNTANASGLSSGRELGHAVAGEGLGIAVLDARLKLLIPVTANSGVYTGVLSITSV